MKETKVSVVIPIYNTEKYLDRCLSSVAMQTETDFEVMMVDDGSKDGSAAIAKKYEEDERFKYIYQENGGVSTARNNGLNKASGLWIAFVDSDDALTPDYLKELLANTGDDLDIISCGAQREDEEGVWQPIHFYDGDYIFTDETEECIQNRKTDCAVSNKMPLYLELINSRWDSPKPRYTAIGVPWGKLYRTSFLKENSLEFNPRLKRLQDNIFNMFAFEKARAIKYIDRPLYNYNLDHITGFGLKYEPRAPQFYDLVLRIRREFLLTRGYMKIAEVFNEYCGEVQRTVGTMLSSFYLHDENPMNASELVVALRDKFSDEMYLEAFKNKNAPVKGKRMKTMIFLLKHKKYRELLWFDKFVRLIKGDVVARDGSLRGGAAAKS